MERSPRRPRIAALRIGSVLAGAARLYRLHPVRVAVASIVILLPVALLNGWAHAAADAVPPGSGRGLLLLGSVLPAISGFLALLGLVLLGGVMDELIGAEIRGTPPPGLMAALAGLPLGRLVAADVLVAVVLAAAAGIGVLPGMVLASLVGIAGPVVNIERQGPIGAVRRSLRLTWPHAWLVLGCLVPMFVMEGVAHAFLVSAWDGLGLAGELLVEVPLILTVGAFVTLTEVVLAYALLARDRGSRVAQMASGAGAAAGPDPAPPA